MLLSQDLPSSFVLVRFARVVLPNRYSVRQCMTSAGGCIYYSGFHKGS